MLAFQQLASNSNSSNFNNNNNRISKLPKSLTTTLPTFGGKSLKIELFEDIEQTSLKVHKQFNKDNKVNYFHSLMRSDALQTFKKVTSPNSENLQEILTMFRRKYVQSLSMASPKHKLQRLVFSPANQKLVVFLDELQKIANVAFGVAAQAIIGHFIYAKMPPHLKKSNNQAQEEAEREGRRERGREGEREGGREVGRQRKRDGGIEGGRKGGREGESIFFFF